MNNNSIAEFRAATVEASLGGATYIRARNGSWTVKSKCRGKAVKLAMNEFKMNKLDIENKILRMALESKLKDEEFSLPHDGTPTDDIARCANNGCGFNDDGKCKASGTSCYGYIKTEGDQ